MRPVADQAAAVAGDLLDTKQVEQLRHVRTRTGHRSGLLVLFPAPGALVEAERVPMASTRRLKMYL